MILKYSYLGLLTLIVLMLNGCSLFFGNIKPADEKSNSYGILDLSKTDPSWSKLDPKSAGDTTEVNESDIPESGISDFVFQQKTTASIISVNSACKSYGQSGTPKSLQELTQELLLGISEVSFREEKPLTLNDLPALQTTVKGKIKGEEMKLQTVVLQKVNCVYDLMYIARPEKFNGNENDFYRFVSSLHLR